MIFSMSIRGVGALASLASTSIIITNLGLEPSGLYFSVVAYSLMLATFLSFGMNGVVIKYARTLPYKRIDIVKILLSSLSITALPVSMFFLFLHYLYNIDMAILWMALAFSLAQMLHLLLLARNKVNIAYAALNILPNVFIVLCMLINSSYMYLYYIGAYMSAFIIMTFQSASNNMHCDVDVRASDNHVGGVKERFDFFQQELLGQAFTSISIVLVSLSINSSGVALFNIYLKLSSVSNIILSVLNQSRLSYCLELLSSKNFKKLTSISKDVFRKSILFILAYTVVILIFWDVILDKLFDLDGVSSYPFLVLSLSYCFVAYANVATYMLNSYNYAFYIRNVSYFTFLIGITSLASLPNKIGVLGGVLSVCLMLIIQSYLTKRKFLKVFNVK